MKKIMYYLTFISAGVFFSGCAHEDACIPETIPSGGGEYCATKPYRMNNKIIVGSRQDDAKVVYSIGKILKVWIAPYHQGGTMVASHDNYVVVEKPHFIPGESVTRAGTRPNSAISPTDNFPYVYRDYELDRTGKRNRFSDENIKKYNNNIYRSKEAYNIPATNRSNKANAKYDKKIFQFLGRQ